MNLALSNEEINAILESADSEFMTEEEVFIESENAGRNKINKKLLGIFNAILPPLKRLQDALNGGKISPQEVDGATRRLTTAFLLTGIRPNKATGKLEGQLSGGLTFMKSIAKKGAHSSEFNNEEIAKLEDVIKAIDDWKDEAQMHRDGRTILQKYGDLKAYTLSGHALRSWRDVRELDGIRDMTNDLVKKIEAAKKMVSGHYYKEGYDFTTDDDFGYVIAD